MTEYKFDKEQFFREARAVYETYPSDVSYLEYLLEQRAKEHPKASSFQKKAWIYETAAKHARVRIFPSCPFYGEIDTGRDRNSVTSTFPPQNGIGCWLMKQYPDFIEEYGAWSNYYREHGVMNGPQFMDASHHYANCERVLKLGLFGIQSSIRHRLTDSSLSAEKQDFLNSMWEVCESLIAISHRFSEEAGRLLESERDPMRRQVLTRISKTAAEVPGRPAKTFYEALCAIWFTREMCNALDGLGFAVIAHLDRILGPYYEADRRAGRLTKEEARELIACFLSMTDARWDLEADLPGGTNADIVIGGCDENGSVVYNEISEMVLESFLKYRFANPKLQARIAKDSPEEFLRKLGEVAGAGLNVLSVFHDDTIIEANRRQGKRLSDCRLYVAGGCQEICLSNEVNCRAYTYLNLVQMLNGSLFPEKWNRIFAAEGFTFQPAWKEESFEGFYRTVLANYENELRMFVERYNRFGSMWRVINPSLFFSATMESCTEKAMDVSEGGAVYNTDNFAATGVGTVIDSLYAIKTVVYEEKRVTMERLRRALETNFAGEELLRQYLLHRVPKFCRDKEATEFGKRFLRDLSSCLGGQSNYRGGRFEPSLFAFYSYDWFKDTTIATPDGRKAGTALSRGVNPSESTEDINISTLLGALEELDFTDYPGGAVTYMDIPVMKGTMEPSLFAAVIRAFCENGGSIMDFNVVSVNELLDAQKNPEAHRNIVVRVCGYSAYFHTLTREMQDEVIGRTQR